MSDQEPGLDERARVEALALSLNDAQVAVLEWVATGCPNGVLKGYAHRITAAALRSRELVRITGRGPTWRAELTDRGRAALDRLHQRPSERARHGGRRRRRLSGAPAHGMGRRSEQKARSEQQLKTKQLVTEVLAAGGRLTLPDHTASGGVDWRQRAYAAQRHGKVPAGKRLSVSRGNGVFEIALLDGETGNEVRAEAVPVPARLRRYHPIAQEFRRRTDLHEISRKQFPRALRIVHALVAEAERRGFKVSCAVSRRNTYGYSDWKPTHDGQLVFTVGSHDLKVRVWEKGCGLRGPYEQQMEEWRQDRAKPVRDMLFLDRPKPYDSGATGQLNVAILGWSHRQTSWGDRQRWRLEDRLPQLMREIEAGAAEAEEQRLAKEREATERRLVWEAAMEHAKQQFTRDHRIEILRRRVAAWQEAEAIRAYCDAVEERHGSGAIAAKPETKRWLSFARDYADEAQQLPEMPEDPEITREALGPYLGKSGRYGSTGW